MFRLFQKTDYTMRSDEELMVLITGRDEKAFDVLYDRYSRRVYYFLLRLNGNDTETANDLLQETFLRVFEKSNLYNPEKKCATWIFTIAANLQKNAHRSATRASAVVVPMPELKNTAQVLQQPDFIDQKLFRLRLDKALNELDDIHRMVFMLRFTEELTVPEIAVILDIPEGTVKSRIHHTVRRLSERLHDFSPHFNPQVHHEQG